MPEQQTSEYLKRKILLFSVLSISIISLIFSITAITPLYNSLKSEQRSGLEHQVQIKSMIVEEFLSRAKATARQITSRTQIRKKLEAYNRKEINLDELLSFTGSKLADAMKLSDDVVGISRLDSSKKLVVQVGIPIPETFWKIPDDSSKAVLVYGPVIIKDESYVILGAPISNRKEQRVGTDIVLFSIKGLQRIVGDYNDLGETGETILGKIENNEVLLFFPLRNSTDAAIRLTTNTSFVGSALVETAKQKNGIIDFTNPSGPNAVIAYGSIHNGMWGMMIKMDKKELYYSINREILFISLVILFLIALGTIGMMIVLRPLTGKILMHTSDLEAKIEEKTSELMNTSNKLKETNTNLNNEINEHIRTEEMMRSSQSVAHICSYSTNLNVNEIEKSSWVCSPEFYNIFGIDKTYPHTIEGWANFIHPDYREEVFDYHESVVKEKKTFSLEYKIIRHNDGAERWVHGTGELEYDEKGTPVRMHGAIQDITERRRSEVEKEKLQSQLVQAQKMESIGHLAGGVAHDFNNMLGVILGHTEMALEETDPASSLYANLHSVHQAGERSADLTRQLLAFARKQTIAPKVIDINDIVAGMLNMLRRLIGEDINLLWQPGINLQPVKVDPAQIDQILANLCVNARDAIDGVGKVVIITDTKTFNEDYCHDQLGSLPGEYILLEVSDDGCGIDKKTLDHIFEPFFTTKEQGKGTGLGLASIYGIVKQNNGFINVDSEPDHGTTFKIYLPVYAAKSAEVAEKTHDLPAEHGSETILLVEDESAILTMTTTMLTRLGYNVVAAATPGEAIRLAQEYQGEIDLLMTDVVMPEMNGQELAKNLLSHYPDLKRLFMSGYTANVITHYGVLDEGIHFIQKPFSKKDLGGKVREALKG